MKLNVDYSERVAVNSEAMAWQPSPLPGVERRMLERDGGEVARATSVVRYQPGSAFDPHTHELGEEFLVLAGVFSDEMGDYPAGTYVRNPPGSKHRPSSRDGCVLLVKLRYMGSGDRGRLVVDTSKQQWQPVAGRGLWIKPLFDGASENVALVKFDPGGRRGRHVHAGGEELFVLSGEFEDEFGRYGTGTWLRSPDGSSHSPFSHRGCVLYRKTGHLPR